MRPRKYDAKVGDIYKTKLTEEQRRRYRKLTKSDYVAIRMRYAKGYDSTYSIARDYGVSQATIWYVLHPEYNERRDRERDRKYIRKPRDNKAEAKRMREIRKYKLNLYLKGDLKVEGEKNENDN